MATNKRQSFTPKTSGVNVDETDVITGSNVSKQEFEASDESASVSEGVNANPNVEQREPTKTVRINPAVDHTCVIGGTRYTFKKGVCQNVPPEVKTILNKNGLLSPL